MPNVNPAGPFQPMNQHPMAWWYVKALGGDTVFFKASPGESLIFPTVEGVTRLISSVGLVTAYLSTQTQAVDWFDIYLKDHDGNKYSLFAQPILANALPPAFDPVVVSSFAFLPFLDIYLRAEDFSGLYFEMQGGGDADIRLLFSYFDVRGVEVFPAEITQAALNFPTLNPSQGAVVVDSAPVGESYMLPLFYTVPAPGGQTAWNFDSVVHNGITAVYDGSDIMPVLGSNPPLTPLVNPNGSATASFLITTQPFGLPIPSGTKLLGYLGEPIVDGPVRTFFAALRTNQSPVRQDQGGAY